MKVSKGYPSPPCITSPHRVFPYKRRMNPSLTVTRTFPSHQQVVLTALDRNAQLRHCRRTKLNEPFSWKGSLLASYALEKNPVPKFSFSELTHNKSWSTTSTINSWAIYSVRLALSQVQIWRDKTLQKLCNILLAGWNFGGRQVKLQSSSALTLKGNN